MIPVFQTQFEKGKGNCLQACLASILEMPYVDALPDFHKNAITLAHQIENEDAFLASLYPPMRAIRVLLTGAYDPGDALFCFDGFAIAWGPSPRIESSHAVVVKSNDGNLELAHDPHPDGNGLERYDGIEFIVLQPFTKKE